MVILISSFAPSVPLGRDGLLLTVSAKNTLAFAQHLDSGILYEQGSTDAVSVRLCLLIFASFRGVSSPSYSCRTIVYRCINWQPTSWREISYGRYAAEPRPSRKTTICERLVCAAPRNHDPGRGRIGKPAPLRSYPRYSHWLLLASANVGEQSCRVTITCL